MSSFAHNADPYQPKFHCDHRRYEATPAPQINDVKRLAQASDITQPVYHEPHPQCIHPVPTQTSGAGQGATKGSPHSVTTEQGGGTVHGTPFCILAGNPLFYVN